MSQDAPDGTALPTYFVTPWWSRLATDDDVLSQHLCLPPGDSDFSRYVWRFRQGETFNDEQIATWREGRQLTTARMRHRGLSLVPSQNRCVCGSGDYRYEAAPDRVGSVWTYFLIRQRWVKIGRSVDPLARLVALRRRPDSVRLPPEMDPEALLRLAHLEEGDVEHSMHGYFADHHAAGEWFDAQPVMRLLAENGALG